MRRTILKVVSVLVLVVGVVVGSWLVRHALAAGAVERSWQRGPTERLHGVGTTQSPSPLLHTPQRLGVGPGDVDLIVLSHLHPDHVGGLGWWLRRSFSLGNTQLDLGERRV